MFYESLCDGLLLLVDTRYDVDLIYDVLDLFQQLSLGVNVQQCLLQISLLDLST